MRREGLALIVAVAALAALARPAAAQRHVVPLDTGWSFVARDDFQPAALAGVAAHEWERVTLPHTWNALDATDMVPGYRRGGGWYRRMLDAGALPADARILLACGAANTMAEVWVNGARAGYHVGGYVPFEVDLTPYLRRDRPNEILVHVDNADHPELIPSGRSDFVIYGGLTRGVELRVVPGTYIARVEARTPGVTRERATLRLDVVLANAAHGTGERTLEARLLDPRGKVVARRSTRVTFGADSARVTLDLPVVARPELWSPAHPALYRAVITAGEGAARDSVETRVGFRFYRFAEHGPFYLNGERLLIRGTQRHEEHAGLGGAVPDSIQVADLAAIKAMGANFVRLAHYPQSDVVYRAADSLGILVWDELPWDRGGVGGREWKANTRALLREQIHRNVSHPSIILWSLGNEVSDVIEPPNVGEVDSLRAFVSELRAIAKEIDPARPTAMRKFDAGADLLDVYSPSLWAGWYGGVYRKYEGALLGAHAKFPRLVHMEYGADAHYGRHTDTPISGEGLRIEPGVEEAVGTPVANVAREGDWSESYQTDLLEWHLMVSERQDWFPGAAQWVFQDFATPLRPENPIPYVNEKGLRTRDGTPKDAYFLYKSWWTDSPKFAYIVSHSWTERGGPKGKPRQVRVFSNCQRVELLLNGVSQGAQPRVREDFPAQGLRWDVGFAEGANALAARCVGAAESAADTLDVHYTSDPAGRAADIRLSSRRLPNGNLLVEAILVDAKGRRVLDASDRIYFDHNGGGRLLTDLGTPRGSRAIEAANGRAAIELEPPGAGTRAIVVARTQALNGARLFIDGPAGASAPPAHDRE